MRSGTVWRGSKREMIVGLESEEDEITGETAVGVPRLRAADAAIAIPF